MAKNLYSCIFLLVIFSSWRARARGRVYTESLGVQQLQHYFSRCVSQPHESTLTSTHRARNDITRVKCCLNTRQGRATVIYKLMKATPTARTLGNKNKISSTNKGSRDAALCAMLRASIFRAFIVAIVMNDAPRDRANWHAHGDKQHKEKQKRTSLKSSSRSEFRGVSFDDGSAVSSVRDDGSIRGTSSAHTAFSSSRVVS